MIESKVAAQDVVIDAGIGRDYSEQSGESVFVFVAIKSGHVVIKEVFEYGGNVIFLFPIERSHTIGNPY